MLIQTSIEKFSNSDKFNVSMQTVNNWISGRIFLPPSVAVKLQDMGIPKKAIRNPSDMV